MTPREEIEDFRRRFPDPRPMILARLAEHSMVCKCRGCLEAYAENVGPVAQGHRLADALEASQPNTRQCTMCKRDLGVGNVFCSEECVDKFFCAPERAEPDVGADTPWPLHEIVKRLAGAAEHLLQGHNCDAHGYEGVGYALDAARSWLAEEALKRG